VTTAKVEPIGKLRERRGTREFLLELEEKGVMFIINDDQQVRVRDMSDAEIDAVTARIQAEIKDALKPGKADAN
jgi:hypothetical protein